MKNRTIYICTLIDEAEHKSGDFVIQNKPFYHNEKCKFRLKSNYNSPPRTFRI